MKVKGRQQKNPKKKESGCKKDKRESEGRKGEGGIESKLGRKKGKGEGG